ncbi:MAG: MerR family transcriptional regulator [Hyphomicrobium sp.]|nr:MerR family transcriptional regulator [Hyphomicrobium sp.]
MSKAAEAFRTISEVADDLDVPKHVLRFWEAKFPQIRPMKRGGGRRYYRPEDMELLRGIRHLLHAEGYTIKGVQKILREHGVDHVKAHAERALPQAKTRGRRTEPVTPSTVKRDAAAHKEMPESASGLSAQHGPVPADGKGRDARRPSPGPSLSARGAIEAAIVELRALRKALTSEPAGAKSEKHPAVPARARTARA